MSMVFLAFRPQSRRQWQVPMLLLLVASLAILVSPRAQAHTPHDEILDVALSPSYFQDRTVFILTSDTQTPASLFRSDDGGATWQELVNGLTHQVTSVAVSPAFAQDHIVLVGTHTGVYRSDDSGDSWQPINNELAVAKIALSPAFAADHTACVITTATELYCTQDQGASWKRVLSYVSVNALAFVEMPRGVELLVGDSNGYLYLSRNHGRRWKTLTLPLTHGGAITALAIAPQVWLVGTEADGVFRSFDGATFVPVNSGDLPGDESVTSLAISPDFEHDQMMFATTFKQAVFRSTDAGNTWTKYQSVLTGHHQADEGHLPYFSKIALSNGFATDGTLFVAAFTGFYQSADRGVHWSERNIFAKYVWTISLSPNYAQDATALLGEYTGGIYKTQDSGRSWRVLNRNIWVLRPFDISFSPSFASDETIFMGMRDYFYRSTDGGENWIARNIPVGQVVVAPDFVESQTIFIKADHDTVYKSTDAGDTFTLIWQESATPLARILISPDYAHDKTLFLRVEQTGVYRSQNDGQDWQPVNNGLVLPANDVHPTLIASPDFAHDQTLFTTTPAGLFKSTNGGNLWVRLASVPYTGENRILALAISPDFAADQTLFVSIIGHGLYKSEDGGQSFAEIAPWLIQNHQIFDVLTVSPTYAIDHTLFGAGRELFKSIDGGNSWSQVVLPIRYEDNEEPVLFGPVEEGGSARKLGASGVMNGGNGNMYGHWRRVKGTEFSATTSARSGMALDTAGVDFIGNCVGWVGSVGSDQGIANVYVDGTLQAVVDQYNPTPATMLSLFAMNGLDDDPHTILVEVTGTKNPLSSGYRIYVDAFDVDSLDGDGGWCQ